MYSPVTQADKWRNTGGKNGLLLRPVPPELVGGETGLELARRRGIVSRARPGQPQLKYVQFRIGRGLNKSKKEQKKGANSPEPGESKPETVLLFQVVGEAGAAARPRARGSASDGPANAIQKAGAQRPAAQRAAGARSSTEEFSETESSGADSPLPPGSPSTESTEDEAAAGGHGDEWTQFTDGDLDTENTFSSGDIASIGAMMPTMPREVPGSPPLPQPELPPIAETEPSADVVCWSNGESGKRKLSATGADDQQSRAQTAAVVDAGVIFAHLRRGSASKVFLTTMSTLAVATILLTEPVNTAYKRLWPRWAAFALLTPMALCCSQPSRPRLGRGSSPTHGGIRADFCTTTLMIRGSWSGTLICAASACGPSTQATRSCCLTCACPTLWARW